VISLFLLKFSEGGLVFTEYGALQAGAC
jgi:hypothetical protein